MKLEMLAALAVVGMLAVLLLVMALAFVASNNKFDRDVSPVYGAAQSGPAYLG